MSSLFLWFLSPIGKIIGAIAGIFTVLVGAWLSGRSKGRQEILNKAEKEKADALEKIAKDLAQNGAANPNDAREWLHKFGDGE
ncbi:hypothetical protein D6827_01760 [Candidatus Parcubacteria bacterium]|nr:MAG: hypothetical protein D6827_01760 [Candidatus Parcubacteria bacterium]